MADSKSNPLSDQVESAIGMMKGLPPDLQVSVIVEVAQGLPLVELELLTEKLARLNRTRQGNVYVENWFTMADLKKLFPDNCYLVIKIWRWLLLTYFEEYNLRIQTGDGKQWELSFAKDAQCSQHARVDSISFLRAVDHLVADIRSATHFADFDERAAKILETFAGHLE
ncbi:hypothetical protein EOM60_06200 [Candidatus Saccharibacteria bacterium]|nr:hypothetical protein [Candidatus Saccharibacteria bacterium]